MMNGFPFGSMMMNRGLFWGSSWFTFLPLLLIWSLVWKGISLWHAAKRDEKGWFVVFLVLNTAGILELLYLFLVVKFFSKEKAAKPTPKRK